MTARGARIAIVSVCVGLAVAGTFVALFRLPPSLPGDSQQQDPRAMSQADLEALLGRVARSLDPQLRSKLAEAVLSESARAGYDPLFILGLVSVESGFRTHVSSERGAYGLMQLRPSTFAETATETQHSTRPERRSAVILIGPTAFGTVRAPVTRPDLTNSAICCSAQRAGSSWSRCVRAGLTTTPRRWDSRIPA